VGRRGVLILLCAAASLVAGCVVYDKEGDVNQEATHELNESLRAGLAAPAAWPGGLLAGAGKTAAVATDVALDAALGVAAFPTKAPGLLEVPWALGETVLQTVQSVAGLLLPWARPSPVAIERVPLVGPNPASLLLGARGWSGPGNAVPLPALFPPVAR
jgi:hypothetical protein